jgi:hypothetical protein
MARPSGFNEITLNKFKGLDISGPAELIDDRSFQSLINFEIGNRGELKRRPGITKKSQAAAGTGPIKILGSWSSKSRNEIIIQVSSLWPVQDAGKVYRTVDGGVTFTQISSPVGTNYNCGQLAQYGGVAHIPTTSGLFTWDGVTWTAIAGPPATNSRAVVLQDRLFLLKRDLGPPVTFTNILFSDPGAFNVFPVANSIGYTTEDRDQVVGLLGYRDRLLALRSDSIIVLYLNGPPSSWVQKKLPFNIGCINENCAVVYQDLIYILSAEGVYRTDLTQIEEISKPIAPIFNKRRELYTRYTNLDNTDCIGYWNGRIVCHIRTDQNAYRLMVYNIKNNAWTEWLPGISTGPGAYMSIRSMQPVFTGRRDIVTPSTDYNKEGLYITSWDNLGRFFIFDDEDPVYQDENFFVSTARTKQITADTPMDLKRSYVVVVKGTRQGVTAPQGKYNVNGTNGALFTIPIDTTGDAAKLKGPGYFRNMSLEITYNGTDYLEIESISTAIKRKTEVSEILT